MRWTFSLVCVRLIHAPYLLIGLPEKEETLGIESIITLFYVVLREWGKFPSGYKVVEF